VASVGPCANHLHLTQCWKLKLRVTGIRQQNIPFPGKSVGGSKWYKASARIPWLEASSLSSLQSFNAVGLVTGMASGPLKNRAIYFQTFFSETSKGRDSMEQQLTHIYMETGR